jgi:hypothetical protein
VRRRLVALPSSRLRRLSSGAPITTPRQMARTPSTALPRRPTAVQAGPPTGPSSRPTSESRTTTATSLPMMCARCRGTARADAS